MIQSFKALVVINQCYSENAITLLSIVYLWLEFLFILQETTGCPNKFWTAKLGRTGGMVYGGMGWWSIGDHTTLVWFPSETIGCHGIF